MTPNKNFEYVLPIPQVAEISFNVFLFLNVQFYMSFISDVNFKLH